MKRRKWDPKTKALAVLGELKGRPVAKLCNEHQISQAQRYQWRDQFLGNAFRAFEIHRHTHREVRLEWENGRLKALVSELTSVLKNNDDVPR